MSDGKAALLKVLAAKKPAASSSGPPPIQVKRAALLPCLSIVGAEVACPKLRQQFKLPRGVVLSEAEYVNSFLFLLCVVFRFIFIYCQRGASSA
jgi:hypothetical protein